MLEIFIVLFGLLLGFVLTIGITKFAVQAGIGKGISWSQALLIWFITVILTAIVYMLFGALFGVLLASLFI